jgi:DNA-binding NarL/FixJ family response regulator
MQDGRSLLAVYLVEDSPIIVRLLQSIFTAEPGILIAGHSDDAETALAEIATARPDVVVIDLALRRGNGFDVVRGIRHLAGEPASLPVILTNHTSAAYRTAAAQLGVAHFHDKATDIPALWKLVRRMADERTSGRDGPDRSGSERSG